MWTDWMLTYLLLNLFVLGAIVGSLLNVCIHRLPLEKSIIWPGWVVFGFHAVLVCFRIVASFCDFDYREIPCSITVPGTVIGLVGAVLFPWPWPYPYTHQGGFDPLQAVKNMPSDAPWWQVG